MDNSFSSAMSRISSDTDDLIRELSPFIYLGMLPVRFEIQTQIGRFEIELTYEDLIRITIAQTHAF